MKTNIYFDGFNFYYGAVRGTPHKWCNLLTLCQLSLPAASINRIWYFTAPVKPTPQDPDQPKRQDLYLRALRSIPCLEIVAGDFRKRRRAGVPILGGQARGPLAQFEVVEEKGSDVNLAIQLYRDVAQGNCEAAYIVSDDSDLIRAVTLTRQDYGVQVGILNPFPAVDPITRKRRYRTELQNAASPGCYHHIQRVHLAASQFPNPLTLPDGTVLHKPRHW
jgi:hypothetical protein